jgi:hypothetical protein
MNPQEKRLIGLLRQLQDSDRATLLTFAEFLVTRTAENPPETPPRLNPLPRPVNETVIGAIKRLSATYPMLDKAKMLNDTSRLMSKHIMEGKSATEVIDELEMVFERHYHVLNADDLKDQ